MSTAAADTPAAAPAAAAAAAAAVAVQTPWLRMIGRDLLRSPSRLARRTRWACIHDYIHVTLVAMKLKP